MVLKFVKEKRKDLIDFISEYGLPQSPAPDDAMILESILEKQTILRGTLDHYYISNRPDVARILFQRFVPHLSQLTPELELQPSTDKLMLSFRPRDLYAFMTLEIASILTGGTKLCTCMNCKTLFATGGGKGKRQGAFYCSNSCRVAHQRQRAREAGRGRLE
jgi:hypothetical protein